MAACPGGYEQAGDGEDVGGALSPGGGVFAGGDPGGFVYGGGLAAEGGYGLMAKLRVVQPELEEPPPGADSIEDPHTWPVVPVAGEAGSGLAPA